MPLTSRGPMSSARTHLPSVRKPRELQGASQAETQLSLFAGIDGKALPKPSPQTLEQSDEGVVPKIAAKTWVTPVESKEGEPEAKGNAADGRGSHRTQSRESVDSVIERIGHEAKQRKETRFTNLTCHLKRSLLLVAYRSLNRKAAWGVNRVTWEAYGVGLSERLQRLEDRIHRGSYKVLPVRRVFIPKGDGRMRPLGIPALEDKIVQQAVRMLLEPIYEATFVPFSHGYRPKRGALGAVKALHQALTTRRIGYLLDADIQAFFDSVDHAKMLAFLERKIGDPRILQLISAWLKAGVMTEQGFEETEEGTPQGGIISPLLANIYLHYVLDVFVANWRKQAAHGQIIVVRYADDFVIGAQKERDIRWLHEALQRRFADHGLTLHPKKTKVMEFGRNANRRRRRRGEDGQPTTFDFLGFTHISHQDGPKRPWKLLHITSRKKRNAKLKTIRAEMRLKRHSPLEDQHRWLCAVLRGHANYYGVAGNSRRLSAFRWEVTRAWIASLRRRSQRGRRLDIEWLFQRYPIPQMRVVHSFEQAA
jgi:RNA-directed DNA polymerase